MSRYSRAAPGSAISWIAPMGLNCPQWPAEQPCWETRAADIIEALVRGPTALDGH